MACMNPNIKKITHGKPIVYLFNKIDLADEKKINIIRKQFAEDGKITLASSAKDLQSKTEIKEALRKVLKDKIERNLLKQVRATYKVLVLGVPNTGKSSLINLLSGSKKAKTGNIAGVTRVNQWVRIDDDFVLLDTPGVLWPKFDEGLSVNLAYVGSLSDKEFDLADLGFELMKTIYEKYPDNLKSVFSGVDFEFEEFIELYDRLCLKRGYIMRGGEVDYNRAGKSFIDDFRAGKFGKITLE